ncbi:MAG: hypothetical protein RR400_02890 [Clostridia bacterium]
MKIKPVEHETETEVVSCKLENPKIAETLSDHSLIPDALSDNNVAEIKDPASTASLKENETSDNKKSKAKSNWNKFKKTSSKIFNILLIPIFIFAMFFSLSLLISKKTKGVPMIMGYSMIKITSGSMVKAGFDIGETAFIKRENPSGYQIGDHIAFFDYVDPNVTSPELGTLANKPSKTAGTSRIVFHTIVKIVTDANGDLWFYTKGSDNANVDTNAIHQNYLIGRYVEISPSLMSFINFIISAQGAVILIVIPCGFLLFKDCIGLVNLIYDRKDYVQNSPDDDKENEKNEK